MLNRNLILGSVASFALACAAALPSYAQSLPRDSTPAEMAETDALNAQQAAEPGIIVTQGSTVVASDDTGTAVADYDAALTAQSSAQSQYDSQLSDYQQKRNAYDRRQQDYRQKLDNYNRRAEIYRDNTAIYNLEN